MGNRNSADLINLERKLQKDLEIVLEQMNIHWFQKSRSVAIYEGDRNIAFLHALTIIQRSHNKIEELQDHNNIWFWKEETLKDMVTTFFQNLYLEKNPDAEVGFTMSNFPTMEESHLCQLSSPFDEHFEKALKGMAPFKALAQMDNRWFSTKEIGT